MSMAIVCDIVSVHLVAMEVGVVVGEGSVIDVRGDVLRAESGTLDLPKLILGSK